MRIDDFYTTRTVYIITYLVSRFFLLLKKKERKGVRYEHPVHIGVLIRNLIILNIRALR